MEETEPRHRTGEDRVGHKIRTLVVTDAELVALGAATMYVMMNLSPDDPALQSVRLKLLHASATGKAMN